MYIGIHKCKLIRVYDMFLMAECIRSSTSDSEERSLNLEQDTIATVLTSYTALIFNVMVQDATKKQSTNFMLNQRVRDVSRLIKANSQHIESLKHYSTRQLNFSSNLQQIEKNIMAFKRKCEFGEKSDLFVYEFDIDDVIEFFVKESNSFSSKVTPDKSLLYYEVEKVNLTVLNFLIDMIFKIDLIWRINEEKLKIVSNFQVAHYFDKTPTHQFISPTSLYFFFSINFSDPSYSLYLSFNPVLTLQCQAEFPTR